MNYVPLPVTYYSDAIPKETFYLVPDPGSLVWGTSDHKVTYRRHPWGPPPEGANNYERDRALAFLASLLDRTYEEYGWDPEIWREARWAEQTKHDVMRFMAHERVSMSISRPSSSIVGVFL